ncbi:MAG: DUF2461 domain-containing protein [Beijerinckiaceae bacterium]|jgi:uncharacterized protein (TIGR02453 family)|nr:DUF2461 domain-containing protein [Beijerinckiaceae bacterium]
MVARPLKTSPVAGFPGFPPETLKFLTALGFHQSREWFQENRGIYLSAFREPLENYIAAASSTCVKKKIPLRGDPKRATFRLNRDVRFSKDKSPYKTNGGAVLTRTGAKGSPGIVYTHIDPAGGFFAAGFYHPEPPQLLAFRKAIAARPQRLLDIEKKLKSKDLALWDRESLTRNPRDFKDVDERIVHAVRFRNYLVRRPYEDAMLQDGAAMISAVTTFAKDAMPLLQFGWDILGEERVAE